MSERDIARVVRCIGIGGLKKVVFISVAGCLIEGFPLKHTVKPALYKFWRPKV